VATRPLGEGDDMPTKTKDRRVTEAIGTARVFVAEMPDVTRDAASRHLELANSGRSRQVSR
jgi:hypothetical protein